MNKYKLTNEAKEDLIRIHRYGVTRFGMVQADKYFNAFFEYFEKIAESPFSFESVNQIRKDYRRCVCGVDSIYYRLNTVNHQIEIMAIIGSQDINTKL